MQDNYDYYSFERKEIQHFIPSGIKRTLDVGCAAGAFSASLKDKMQIEAWGIEMVANVAKIAEKKLDRVLVGTFDEVASDLPKEYFDCVFFNDVLEHMPNPEDCLMKVKQNLAPNGHIIASIPNIRHVSILMELLFKKDWKYQDSGILDRTHLRFFTKKSIIRMFNKYGYDIKQIKGIHSVSSLSLTYIANLIMLNQVEDVKYRQFVVVASPKVN